MADHFAPRSRRHGRGAAGRRDVDRPDGGGRRASAEYLWPARSRQEVLTLPDDFGVLFVPPTTAAGAGRARPQPGAGPARRRRRPASVLDTLRQQARRHGATEVLTRAEQPSNAALREDLDGFSEMSVAFPLLFLALRRMATYVLLTRRVRRERDIIGMLLASGLRRRGRPAPLPRLRGRCRRDRGGAGRRSSATGRGPCHERLLRRLHRPAPAAR